jgi:hypothetical protein
MEAVGDEWVQATEGKRTANPIIFLERASVSCNCEFFIASS